MKKNKIQIVLVGGLILNKDNKVLLTQRNEREFPLLDGKWGLPGGHLEFGDHPEKRLLKEMKEELGVGIKILSKTPFIASYVLQAEKIIYHGLLLCYLCQIIKGQPRIANQENRNFKWFEPEKINFQNCLPGTDVFLYQFLAQNSKLDN